MDKENEKRFKEVQPNSAQRLEFLIVMEYLKKYAYDKEHATTQKEIVDFAEKEYGAYIRRDRVGQILIHMEQLSRNNPELLPFTLKTVELKKIKKYYVPQRMFDDTEIVKIITALNCDGNLSKREVERLTKKFMDVAVNDNQQAELLDRVAKRGVVVDHISSTALSKQELFIRACEKKYRIFFKLKSVHSKIESSKYIPYEKRKNMREGAEPTMGFAAQQYLIDGEYHPVIYLDDIKTALVTTFDNLEITNCYDIFEINSEPVNYDLDGKYKTIEDWLDAHYRGADGILYNFKCKVTTNNERWFEQFKKDFRKYWKKELEYEIVERPVTLVRMDDDGNALDRTVIAYDAVFTIESNRSSFRNWYEDLGYFDEVVVLDPKEANDSFLEEKIERYAKRLTKYGARYTYHIEKEMKPEYKEYLEERKKNWEEFLEKRKQRQKQSQNEGKTDNK